MNKGIEVLDAQTLSVAVILVMALSSFALIAHWLANRSILGLRTLAFGLTANSLGAGLVFILAPNGQEYLVLFGYLCFLLGHMWFWLGIADFWQARTKLLVFTAKILVVAGSIGTLYLYYTGAALQTKAAFVAGTAAFLAFGCTYTVSQALGGSLGLYKGIVRRTSVGSAMAVGLFTIHGVYALYHAVVRAGLAMPVELEGMPDLRILVQFEIMLFAIAFALIVIIVTAERLQAELKIQEMLDPLTKALNKRAFVQVVKAVLARARRNSEPVSLIMMDIDRFKQINTKHGRAVGDQALAMFAELVTEGRRAQDVFCRFGGEEFVFLLPGTPEEGADLVANRIKEKIEKSALAPKGVPIQLTISMGVVTERGDDLDADGMFNMVDRRMHHAQKLQFEKVQSA